MKKTLFAAACIFLTGLASAQSMVKVSLEAWNGLSQLDRDRIQSTYLVEVLDATRYGQIIDNQGVDESTRGTNAGAVLGGAVGQASYIDKSIKNGTYSAKGQLGAAVLGTILGSTLDSSAQTRFHFRYSIRLGNGEILTLDEIRQDAFRQPMGICVLVPEVIPTDQKVCSQTVDSLRLQFSLTQNMNVPAQPKRAEIISTTSALTSIRCKLGNLAPLVTSSEKCKLIGGEELP